MKINNLLKTALIVAGCALVATGSGISMASNAPIDLSANTIEYNSATDMAKASGNVRVTQDGGVLTGSEAQYNFKTQRIQITGGVKVVKGDMQMTSAEIVSNANQDLVANGGVVLTKGPNRLTGAVIAYNQQSQTISMPNGGTANGPTAEISGNVLKGNLKTNTYTANGNVLLYSKTNDFKSTSNQATYVGSNNNFTFTASGNVNIISSSRDLTSHSNQAQYTSANNGELILTGNAVAKQHNNTIRGNTLTVYLGKDVKIK